jgi:4-hydroxybenzoate polyprenyltransferase
MLASTLKQWLKLSRLQAGAATAITSVFGAILLMPKDGVDIPHLMVLFLIGLLFHFYGFDLNEYSDIEIDRFSKELWDKPLIRGTIKKNHALFASMMALGLTIAIAIIYFKNLYATLALLVSILLGGIYDLYGKKFFGADFVLGLSIFFFCIFGALTISTNLTFIVFVVAFLFFIQLAFQTGVTGGMKDIPHDHVAGAKTSPVYLGCRVVGKRLIVTREYRLYVIIIKIIHTGAILLPLLYGTFEVFNPFLLQLMILLILITLMWITTIKALNFRVFHRQKLMRILGMHEIVTYPMVPILIMGIVSIESALFLLFFPILWLACFLFIIYGKFMPDV